MLYRFLTLAAVLSVANGAGWMPRPAGSEKRADGAAAREVGSANRADDHSHSAANRQAGSDHRAEQSVAAQARADERQARHHPCASADVTFVQLDPTLMLPLDVLGSATYLKDNAVAAAVQGKLWDVPFRLNDLSDGTSVNAIDRSNLFPGPLASFPAMTSKQLDIACGDYTIETGYYPESEVYSRLVCNPNEMGFCPQWWLAYTSDIPDLMGLILQALSAEPTSPEAYLLVLQANARSITYSETGVDHLMPISVKDGKVDATPWSAHSHPVLSTSAWHQQGVGRRNLSPADTDGAHAGMRSFGKDFKWPKLLV